MQTISRCQGRPGSFPSAVTCGGTAGEQRSWRSSSAEAAGRFLGTVTKARDCGEEDPWDWPELPVAAWGPICASHHHEPRTGQLAPTARDQMGTPWHLSNSPVPGMICSGSVGSKEAGALQDQTQEAACNYPYTPGRQTSWGQEVHVGSRNLRIRKTIINHLPSLL